MTLLREARNIDEVRAVHDKAVAAELYARIAKDTTLEQDAAEIRIRAKRRAGEMVAAIDKRPGGRSKTESRPRLSELGIGREESSKWQRLAAVPEADFEQKIAKARAQGRPVGFS
jgi:hypothetical protein